MIIRIAGVPYDFEFVPQFICIKCKRITLSGLCGCLNPDIVQIDDALYGIPARSKDESS